MKRKNPKLRHSLAVELFCCLLGSVAFCGVLLPALGQEVAMTDCLLFAAVDILVIFLLSRRWWIAPALLAALALVGLGVLHFFKLWEPVTEYVRGCIAWYEAACPYTLPYSENGSLFLIHLAFCFPVTLLLFLYFRRFPFLPIWIALSGALLVWIYFFSGDTENMVSVAALLLIVLFVLIARTNAGSINRKLGGETIPAAAMEITALAIAPLVLLFAFSMGPKEDGEWQSRGVVNLVSDMGDVFSFWGGSSAGGSFSLGYSGLAPNGGALGGDINPNNSSVLRVKTKTPILLSGAIYDAYNGRSWYDGESLGRFRFGSSLWRGKRREVFTIDKPSDPKAAALYDELSIPAVLDISMNVRFRSFFTNGKLEGVTLRTGGDPGIYFNAQGELFLMDFPEMALNYTVRTRVLDREREDYDEKMRELIALAAQGRDGEYAEIVRTCTAVSDTVEPFVRELTEELTADCETDYDKALAIEQWLGENCAYSQTPGDVPEGRDFVSWFLESREGYCTYYASAMTVMARLVGLPARYVSGYGLKQADRRPDTDSYVATNATAHAWTQVYFRGLGWVDFDPMRWDSFELVAMDEPAPPREEDPERERPTELPELSLPDLLEQGQLPELPEPTAPTAPRRPLITGRLLLILLGCAVAALLLLLLVRFVLLFFRMESFYYRLRRKYRDNGARADACYHQLLKQLHFLGLDMVPSDTILSFCARAEESLGGEESLTEICEPVLLSRFAGREPTDEEVRRMCGFYIRTERTLRRKLGFRRYLWRRMLLGR